MTIPGEVQVGTPFQVSFVQSGLPTFVVDPPYPSPVGSLEGLSDVEDVAGASTGDVLVKNSDGVWRPSSIETGVTPRSYTHNQILASDTWTINHGMGFFPAGILVHDSIGDIVEPADITYNTVNSVILSFNGILMSGVAELS